ncbi:hypothetical protein R1flu_010048 [Riccia fluitans]|uniref:CAAX prenyl protease 2/Lysostaphin resistance protein A-like domain-containing protein n=1 Tax=Riccia fluitans TaxID=41844 RepID=A0ABD1Z3W7_9MARC
MPADMATTTVSVQQLFAPTPYPRSRFGTIALAKNERAKKRKAGIFFPRKEFDSSLDNQNCDLGAPPEESSEHTAKDVSLNSGAKEFDQRIPDQAAQASKYFPLERGVVMKSCIGTSAALAVAGFLARQASHTAATNGWPVPDCTLLMPYTTELWHTIPTVGVVALVSALRQILMRVWPDFAESSEVSNSQVLGNLKAVDYFTISYLSGISEELLFRGALLPFIGPDWRGVFGAGLIFGVLHISGGRKPAFGIWASFVGIIYGVLGLYTHDLATPMAAHSAANLLSAALWNLQEVIIKDTRLDRMCINGKYSKETGGLKSIQMQTPLSLKLVTQYFADSVFKIHRYPVLELPSTLDSITRVTENPPFEFNKLFEIIKLLLLFMS